MRVDCTGTRFLLDVADEDAAGAAAALLARGSRLIDATDATEAVPSPP